jgi:hypothetical protein
MRNTIFLLLLGAILTGSCSTEGTVAPSDDFIIVRAYVYAGEPVDDVRISSAVELGTTDNTIPPINDALVTLIKEGVRYTLVPSLGDSGYYHYPGDDLVIEEADLLRIEAEYDGVTASGETIVPPPPVNVTISDNTLTVPVLEGGGFGSSGDLQELELDVTWNNDNNLLHFITAENIATDPAEISLSFGERAFKLRPGRQFRSRPMAGDTYQIRFMSLSHLGQHEVRVYRVNQEYADLYVTQEQDSRDLNEPLTNIENGFGIFSAFNSQSVYFDVVP